MANLKSPIWNYFRVCDKIKIKQYIHCAYQSSHGNILWCLGDLWKSHSTIPLWNHLYCIYPDIYGKLKNVELSRITINDDPSKVFQKIHWILNAYLVQQKEIIQITKIVWPQIMLKIFFIMQNMKHDNLSIF